MNTQNFDRKYGVASTIAFTLRDPAATSSDLLFNGTAPLQADMLMFKDGVYDSTSDNAPAQVNSDRLYTLAVSAAELQCSELDIIVHDASATTFRDAHLKVRTELLLGNVDIDAATGTKANTSALKLTGYQAGHGLEAIAGATGSDISGALGSHVLRASTMQSGSGTSVVLDASASATNDYYNGALILFYAGTGAGQARVITDYVGGTTTATLNVTLPSALSSDTKYIIIPGSDMWKISPVVELAALPTKTSNYSDFIQFLFQRFAYFRTQTSNTFTMKKLDESTTLATCAVTDSAGTQTFNTLT